MVAEGAIERPGSVCFGGRHRIRAVLLDIDGTLYHQQRLRMFMGLELLGLPFSKRSLRSARRVWHVVSYFRKVRERLRQQGSLRKVLEELQYSETAKHVGIPIQEVRELVEEWMFDRPLKYLEWCRRKDLVAFFSSLKGKGMLIGVFSDYPVAEKLQALKVSKYVSLMLCATDPEINAFKPDPRGFLRSCEVWGLEPKEVLYVGDRPDVDAGGASASGMPCAIITNSPKTDNAGNQGGYLTFSSLSALQNALHTHLDVVSPFPGFLETQ